MTVRGMPAPIARTPITINATPPALAPESGPGGWHKPRLGHGNGVVWTAPAKRDAPATMAVVATLMRMAPAAIMGMLRDFVGVNEP
jgi:hypothetical protein